MIVSGFVYVYQSYAYAYFASYILIHSLLIYLIRFRIKKEFDYVHVFFFMRLGGKMLTLYF